MGIFLASDIQHLFFLAALALALSYCCLFLLFISNWFFLLCIKFYLGNAIKSNGIHWIVHLYTRRMYVRCVRKHCKINNTFSLMANYCEYCEMIRVYINFFSCCGFKQCVHFSANTVSCTIVHTFRITTTTTEKQEKFKNKNHSRDTRKSQHEIKTIVVAKIHIDDDRLVQNAPN